MKYLVFMLFLLSGCGTAPSTATVTPNPASSPEAQAIEEIGEGQEDPLFQAQDGDIKITISFADLPGSVIGMAVLRGDKCDITVDPVTLDGGYEEFRDTLWHEIGHCFGLEHSGVPGDIMYYLYEQPPTKDQIKHFHALLKEARGKK